MVQMVNLSLSQQVVNLIGREIISGEYKSGEIIPTEAQLCDKYGISRTAIREAVKMLTAKGLITSKPRQGIRVAESQDWNFFDSQVLSWLLDSSPSLEVLKEFLEVRLAIEPQAASLASDRCDSEEIAAIGNAINRMKDAAEVNDAQAMHGADVDFHMSILYASGNRFYRQLREFVSTALEVSIQHTTAAKGNNMQIVSDHERVYLAIANGQAERAKHLMVYLVDEALDVIERKLSSKESI